jgi:hypothetical protein
MAVVPTSMDILSSILLPGFKGRWSLSPLVITKNEHYLGHEESNVMRQNRNVYVVFDSRAAVTATRSQERVSTWNSCQFWDQIQGLSKFRQVFPSYIALLKGLSKWFFSNLGNLSKADANWVTISSEMKKSTKHSSNSNTRRSMSSRDYLSLLSGTL